MTEGRVMPSAVEIEELILGAILLDHHAFAEVAAILTFECFYDLGHQAAWVSMEKLAAKDDPIDIGTLTMQMKADGTLHKINGAHGVVGLTNRIATSANIVAHAMLVLKKHVAREQLKFGATVHDMAYDPSNDPMDINDTIGKNSERLSGMLATSKSGTSGDLLQQVKERAEKAATTKGIVGLTTGIQALDKLHGGRQGGHLIILAGRPAMGKSAYALCEALHIAVQGGKVLFLSLEMGAVELMQRAVSIYTGVYLERFRSGEISAEQWHKINEAISDIGKLNFRILDDVVNLSAIRAEARKMKETGGLDVVYIDYLQLVQHSLSGRNRENEVSEISRAFKMMARALNVPVIALSQLSRSVETRGGSKRPMLSDLRESGAIEQDADIVEFLWRPEYYGIPDLGNEFPSTKGLAFILVAKNRHGGLADIPMNFEGALTKFTDWSGALPTPQMQPVQSRLEPNRDFDDQPF